MSPLTWEQLTENVTSEKSVMTMQDCYTKARATSFGIFVGGFSGGLALQAQYHKLLPKRIKAFLILPIACGLSVSLPVHRYLMSDCVTRWKESEAAADRMIQRRQVESLDLKNKVVHTIFNLNEVVQNFIKNR